jgi:hypothetical protein
VPFPSLDFLRKVGHHVGRDFAFNPFHASELGQAALDFLTVDSHLFKIVKPDKLQLVDKELGIHFRKDEA